MEQQNKIETTLEKISLIENIPIEFSINDRRPIRFRCPAINEMLTSVDFKMFATIISLDSEKAKKFNLKFNFDSSSTGKIIQGLLSLSEYSNLLSKYFLKYVENSKFENYSMIVDNEKIMSYELEYIANTILISLGQKDFEEKQEQINENIDPRIAEILKAQKDSEEKLKAIKNKKQKSQKGYSIEEILLAISYEFGLSMSELLQKTYFSVVWYFSFVAKVDAHKLNQMILSSGMSKQKSYSYWLNK
jgi:hypothetical protein